VAGRRLGGEGRERGETELRGKNVSMRCADNCWIEKMRNSGKGRTDEFGSMQGLAKLAILSQELK
jgi:hypothetical protein